jgi:hypothetical protein
MTASRRLMRVVRARVRARHGVLLEVTNGQIECRAAEAERAATAAQGEATLRGRDQSRWNMPGSSGAGKSPLSLSRWVIDGTENGLRSRPDSRSAARTLAPVSRAQRACSKSAERSNSPGCGRSVMTRKRRPAPEDRARNSAGRLPRR